METEYMVCGLLDLLWGGSAGLPGLSGVLDPWCLLCMPMNQQENATIACLLYRPVASVAPPANYICTPYLYPDTWTAQVRHPSG